MKVKWLLLCHGSHLGRTKNEKVNNPGNNKRNACFLLSFPVLLSQ